MGFGKVVIEREVLQMQSNCSAENGRVRFLIFVGQRRRKLSSRSDPMLKSECSTNDSLTCVQVAHDKLMAARIEETRSRFGWGISHI
jgi:hypothetical protein